MNETDFNDYKQHSEANAGQPSTNLPTYSKIYVEGELEFSPHAQCGLACCYMGLFLIHY